MSNVVQIPYQHEDEPIDAFRRRLRKWAERSGWRDQPMQVPDPATRRRISSWQIRGLHPERPAFVLIVDRAS